MDHKKIVKSSTKKDGYVEGIGRRKTAVARVRLVKGKSSPQVNERAIDKYFPLLNHRNIALAPLLSLQLKDTYTIEARVRGGGVAAQAEAIRHGLARAIVKSDEAWKPRLRVSGYLTRDPRMVERKKYGKKKARVSPQWSKR
ncbi:MAG: 30S ribosomal protein S9 [Anaplasmataceae bacterium]|nr:30S ribosomal protein S9 [Anaplasmataceae bacterium]